METILPLFEKDFVEDLIPQKFPFVMIDKMFSFSNEELTSGLKVTKNNIFVINDIFTESGIVEHMAQSVALHTGYQFYLKKETAPTGYIGSIKELSIFKLPKTDSEIQTTVTILHEFAGITLVDLVTKFNGEIIAMGQMKTILAK
jgi:predicted hotdog family 3-hydroxylacyl-ACP dehydratase